MITRLDKYTHLDVVNTVINNILYKLNDGTGVRKLFGMWISQIDDNTFYQYLPIYQTYGTTNEVHVDESKIIGFYRIAIITNDELL